MMKVEVVTPEDYMGDIIGDLNSRRGQIEKMEDRGNAKVVSSVVPLANMFGYVNNLRSMSQGRASYTMLFSHYDVVPSNVEEGGRRCDADQMFGKVDGRADGLAGKAVIEGQLVELVDGRLHELRL